MCERERERVTLIMICEKIRPKCAWIKLLKEIQILKIAVNGSRLELQSNQESNQRSLK